MNTNKNAQNKPVKHYNSQNNPEVARMIDKMSQILMERNYLAYKELADK